MGILTSYDTIYITQDLTFEEAKDAYIRNFVHAVNYVCEQKDKPQQAEKVWELLTSRGDKKLIFGECPLNSIKEWAGIE